jgi:simple sugar transport system permease protein
MVGGALLLALAVLSFALALLGHRPDLTLVAMLGGAFGSTYGIAETLLRTVPVLLCALAAVLPAEGGQINIGGEGQFHAGAIGAAFAAAAAPWLPGVLASLLICCTAVCCGAAWAAVPATLRARLGVNEALVNLFLNYIAIYLLQYLVHGPLRDPSSLGWPMSTVLPAELVLERIGGTRMNYAGFVIIVLAMVCVYLMRFTRIGAELRATGLSPRASAIVGIPVARLLFLSMVIGGGLAGMAGYYEIASVQHRLRLDVALGFGYSGFLVAWICRRPRLLILPVSMVVAGLIVAAENLQVTSGLPAASGDIVQGFLLLFVLLSRPLRMWVDRRRAIWRTIREGVA